MKKIIAIFDGLKFSESTLKYAVNLGIQNDATITGIFLESPTYTSRGIYQLYPDKEFSLSSVRQLALHDKKERDLSADRFEAACQDAGIKYKVHHDKENAINEVIEESKYADLLVIDASETLNRYTETMPTHFIHQVLSGAKCPVLLLPKHFTEIKKISWLYDGSSASIYAFK